jgi:hypothetical protein
MRKFTIGEDWTPKKLGKICSCSFNKMPHFSVNSGNLRSSILLDVAFDVDDVIDINELRGYGMQPGEEELPDLVDERQQGNHLGYFF